MKHDSAIIDFYSGKSADYLGRRLEDIWRRDADRLESIHNYIQVLFPNSEPSQFNAQAPLLDPETVAAFGRDAQLRQNLARSHDVMLGFYGLEYQPATARIVRRADFDRHAANWLTPGNHNFLRITRILKCLMALGLPERARAFFQCLEETHADQHSIIGPRTLAFWKDAVSGS